MVAGLLGAAAASVILLPLPLGGDIYAARRWGVGAGYVAFILGFPVSIAAVPLTVAIHPFPSGDDTSGAGAMGAIVAGIVATNWAGGAALMVAGIRTLRLRLTDGTSRASRPPA